MRVTKFNDFLRLANFFYFLIGIKPYDDPGSYAYKRTLLDNVLFYSGFINMNALLIGEILDVYQGFTKKVQFLDTTMTMAYIGFLLVGECKMLFVRLKKKELSDLIRELHEMFPKTLEEQEAYDMKRYYRQCKIVTYSVGLLYVVMIWTYNLFTILQYYIIERWLQIRIVGKNIPYNAYIPWDYHDHWSFYLLYISGDFAAYTCGIGQVSSDILICAVAIQIVMHYDYVSRNFENHILEVNKESNKKLTVSERQDQHEKDLDFLRHMIAYHAKVLKLSDIMNEIFGIPLLNNFMIVSFVMCFVGFIITSGGTTRDMQFKLSIFLFSSVVQVYLISYFGQLLIDSSSNVADAVGHHNYANTDLRYKKMLVLIIQRAQKPSYLQATSFVSVSRNTMTIIMQLSYKFFALLRTMYAD